mgnify:CR=1 FL=1
MQRQILHFPVNIICTAVALLLGIGSASNFNLKSGAGHTEKAKNYAGCGLSLLVICGVIITVVTLAFLSPLMHVFGATEEVLPYALDYTGITAIGVPFLTLTTGGCHLVRADRSPSFFHGLYADWCDHQYDSGSAVYFLSVTGASKVLHWATDFRTGGFRNYEF